MGTAPAAAETAYLAHRSARNAQRRWIYAVLLLGIATTYLVFYAATGVLQADGEVQRAEAYALAFAWLLLVGACGVGAGRRARSPAFDDIWIALLLGAMVALVRLDADTRDLSAYVLISLPVAIVHGTDARRTLLLHGGALAATALAIAASYPLDPGIVGLLISLAVCGATAVYVSRNVESARREEFLAVYALDAANRRLESSNREMSSRSEELARLNADLAARGHALEEVNRRLEQLAMTDPLTGVANRRLLFESLEREFGRSRRYQHPLAVALIDLDDFGQINKIHGVIAGDAVLSGFASLLRTNVRGVDLIGRYGGEEFALVMPESGAAAAAALLERVRAEAARTPMGARGIGVRFSAGVAALQPGDTDPLHVLDRADRLMRDAKRAGKDRIHAET